MDAFLLAPSFHFLTIWIEGGQNDFLFSEWITLQTRAASMSVRSYASAHLVNHFPGYPIDNVYVRNRTHFD